MSGVMDAYAVDFVRCSVDVRNLAGEQMYETSWKTSHKNVKIYITQSDVNTTKGIKYMTPINNGISTYTYV